MTKAIIIYVDNQIISFCYTIILFQNPQESNISGDKYRKIYMNTKCRGITSI
jgi:hypothetical protein